MQIYLKAFPMDRKSEIRSVFPMGMANKYGVVTRSIYETLEKIPVFLNAFCLMLKYRFTLIPSDLQKTHWTHTWKEKENIDLQIFE